MSAERSYRVADAFPLVRYRCVIGRCLRAAVGRRCCPVPRFSLQTRPDSRRGPAIAILQYRRRTASVARRSRRRLRLRPPSFSVIVSQVGTTSLRPLTRPGVVICPWRSIRGPPRSLVDLDADRLHRFPFAPPRLRYFSTTVAPLPSHGH